MKFHVYDVVRGGEYDMTREELIYEVQYKDRMLNFCFNHVRNDPEEYLFWDKESWMIEDASRRRFIRYYELKGKVLRDMTGHNIHDLAFEFHPEEAIRIELA